MSHTEIDDKQIDVLLLRAFRHMKRHGLSYRRMAALVGAKSHVTVYRWGQGKGKPSPYHIYNIKVMLGIIK